MKHKKGVIEVQFNWIFVIFIGALILIFFTTLVIKSKSTAETRIQATISRDLAAILSGAEVSIGTVNTVAIPKVDIEYECDKFTIGRIPRPIRNKIFFTPDIIRGRYIITWALDWSVPFRVTNFLFLTSPEVRIVFLENTGEPKSRALANKIREVMPEKILYEFADTGNTGEGPFNGSWQTEITDNNNYKVRFIFLDPVGDSDPPTEVATGPDPSLNDRDLTFVWIGGTEDFGKVTYFKKQPGATVYTSTQGWYIDDTSFLSTIFAEDGELHNCNMGKAFTRLVLIADIYATRSDQLATSYGAGTPCRSIHGLAKDTLESMKSLAGLMVESQDQSKMDLLRIKINDIEGYNQDALLNSCALIY